MSDFAWESVQDVKNIDAASRKLTLTESDFAWKSLQNVKNIDATSGLLTRVKKADAALRKMTRCQEEFR